MKFWRDKNHKWTKKDKLFNGLSIFFLALGSVLFVIELLYKSVVLANISFIAISIGMNIGIFYSLYGISKIKKKNTKEKPNKKDKFFYIFAFVLILLGWFLCITDIIYKNITKDYESTAINLGFGLCFTGLIILLFYHIYTFSKNINIDEKNHDHQNKSE